MSFSDEALRVLPPVEGAIGGVVLATTASTVVTLDSSGFWAFTPSVDAFVIFSTSATITDPETTIAPSTTAAMAYLLPQDVEWHRFFDGAPRYFKVISTGNGSMRYHKSGV